MSTQAKNAALEVNVDDQNCGGVFALVKNVIEHNMSDIQIDIAAIEPFEDEKNIRFLNQFGCCVYPIGTGCNKLKKQLVVYTNLKKLLQKKKYRYVHIHADTANKLLVSGIAAKRSGTERIILHSHSSGIDGGHRIIKRVFHILCRRLLKWIGTDFVSCSDLAAKWMFPNIPPQQIAIINNGIRLEQFRFCSETRQLVRTTLGLTDELLIGHVGRFNYQKNHSFLIRVMKEISERDASVKLLLIGKGDLEDDIRQQVRKYGLDGCVIFYGITDQVHKLMQAMDVFALPSHFEGLPIVGVEAQAAGLPAVFAQTITREAGVLENSVFLPITENAVNTWADTIMRLSKSATDRSAAYSVLKSKGFDISSTVNSFLHLYKSEQDTQENKLLTQKENRSQ